MESRSGQKYTMEYLMCKMLIFATILWKPNKWTKSSGVFPCTTLCLCIIFMVKGLHSTRLGLIYGF